MLDVFSIAMTVLAVLFVIVRAIALDSAFPWFEDEPSPADRKDSGAKANAAAGQNRSRGF